MCLLIVFTLIHIEVFLVLFVHSDLDAKREVKAEEVDDNYGNCYFPYAMHPPHTYNIPYLKSSPSLPYF